MKVIITGSAGLVGQNLTLMLLKEGYEVVAIDKNEHNLNILKEVSPKAKAVLADLYQKGGWESLFKNADCVVQLQAQIASPYLDPFIKNNISSVENVLDACKKHKVKNLVHLSSSVVISVANDNYTNTKRKGELLVKKSKVPFTILRPPLLYGYFDAKHLGYLARILERSPIFPVPGSGKYMRQPLYVKDLCKIILNLIKSGPKNKVYNIIGKERIDFIDIMKTIARTKNLHRLFLRIPIPIFLAMVKTYNLLTRKPTFIPDQLKALIAGDDFPVEDWEKEFKVKYTPLKQGIEEIYNSPYIKYNKRMISPN